MTRLAHDMTLRHRQPPTPPTARVVAAAVALVIAAFAVIAGNAQAADRYRRAFNWSGYRWMVRSTKDRADPGHNLWGDSRANVHVRADRRLVLRISRGRSVELVGPPTGYGTYRWVVDTNLAAVDPFRVVAFFVYGTAGELDLEFSRWGIPDLGTTGTWVSWRGLTRLGFASFLVSPAPPYVLQVDWKVGATRFTMQDASGALLLDVTVPSGNGGHHVAPHLSYWRFPRRGTNRAPSSAATNSPPVVVRSFRYTPLAATGPASRTSARAIST